MMEEPEDLYAILQVHPKASPEVIKKAYHTLISKSHPDKGGSVELAKQINLAYDVLGNTQKREDYDRLRKQLQLRKQLLQEKMAKAAAKPKKKPPPTYPEPPRLKKLTGTRHNPIAWGKHLLVSDQRGKRILVLNDKGETVWSYGRQKGEGMGKPQAAVFTPDGHILVTDAGKQKVLQLNLKKQTTWEYTYQDQSMQIRSKAEPIFAQALEEGGILLTDKGNRSIYKIDTDHRIQWEFKGKLAFQLSLQHTAIKPEQFVPVSAHQLDTDRFLIADQGNGKIYEINAKGKLQWIYPNKKNQSLTAINSVFRLKNGNTWICSDKMIEVDHKGEVVWEYKQLKDSDIKQAYPLDEGCFLIDFSHLVKKGINQEIMKVNQKNKILYRHYYSQYRFI